jgi:hypothetical protein
MGLGAVTVRRVCTAVSFFFLPSGFDRTFWPDILLAAFVLFDWDLA